MKQEWLLCDLHLHSHYSKIKKASEKHRLKEMSAEEYVKILNDKKVKIISITDHNYFSSDYYDQIEEHIKTQKIDMKLINGVELDAYVELENKKIGVIHICVYIEEKVNRKKLEEVINNLYGDSSSQQKKPLFTDIIEKLHELDSKFIVIPHGNKERGLLSKIKLSEEEKTEFYKYAMYKIYNAFDVNPNFYKTSEKFWATTFFKKSKNFVKLLENMSSSEMKILKKKITYKIKDKTYSLDKKTQDVYDYIINYGNYFAYFSFSDWHNNETYDPKINNFIFGSLETAFSSFEISTLDPTSRILRSQEQSIDIPSTILSKVQFKIGDDFHEIEFSPGLNAVVGKRGSGKTLLLSIIRNLVNESDNLGALNIYKSLDIKDISAFDRSNIKISLGGLNSVNFLTQNEIKKVFEEPESAIEEIANHFPKTTNIDLSQIKEIIKVGKELVPYNYNLKNLTSNILSIKETTDFNYNFIKEINNINLKTNFQNIIKGTKELIEQIQNIKMDPTQLLQLLNSIILLKEMFLKKIDMYNAIINENNKRIKKINSQHSINAITTRQNLSDIRNAIINIEKLLEIKLNFEKFKYLLENFNIINSPVEVAIKSNYLFVTYFDIPENINEKIKDEVYNSVVRSSVLSDLDDYLNGKNNKKLKYNYKNLVDGVEKMLDGNYFQAKKEFYEINNKEIDYKIEIKTKSDLNENVDNGNIINLTLASLGMKSVAYLDLLFDLESSILVLDQPEDNIDNDYISNYLVPNIKSNKRIKQLIFATHNPSVAVYGDAFNYIYASKLERIKYENFYIEKKEDKEKLIKVLEGGKPSFSNRNKKYGNVLGEEEYGNN